MRFVCLALGLALCACTPRERPPQAPASTPEASPSAPPSAQASVPLANPEASQAALEGAIHALRTDLALGDVSVTSVATHRTDLDGDGHADALLYLEGVETCGSGGCMLAVLRYEPASGAFSRAGVLSLVQRPVRVSERRTAGWRDLILPAPGGGGRVALRYAGGGYPEDPSAQPLLSAPDPSGETAFTQASG